MLLPLAEANAIVAGRIEPVFSLVRPGLHTSLVEYVLLLVVLGCIPAGAYVTARPLLDRRIGPTRAMYVINGDFAAPMLAIFVILASALRSDIYRCAVLGVPNATGAPERRLRPLQATSP